MLGNTLEYLRNETRLNLGHCQSTDQTCVFLSLSEDYKTENLARLYINEIVARHGKANVVTDALSRKEWMKPRRARSMSMTIHSAIKAKILEAQSEASKVINTLAERLRGFEKQLKRKEDDG
nr:putative reverse transcriptase domain-containing protein [Tanacetum cinerariifolium]